MTIGISLLSGAKGRTAARRAGAQQELGLQRGLDVQEEQLGIAREDILGAEERAREGLEPFQQFGAGAISPLQNLLGSGIDAKAFLEQTPGFQVALEGGRRAIDTGAASAGLFGSGARGKALTEFGQDLATRTLGAERNALFRAADIGRGAGTDLARVSTGTGTNLATRGSAFATSAGNLLTGIGRTRAETILDRNTAFQNTLSDITGQVGRLAGAATG